YAGRPTILAYDLRNEPTYWTLQTAIYPDKSKAPILGRQLIDQYGEQSAKFYIDAFRASDEGKNGPLAIPERFSDDEAYVYHNNCTSSPSAGPSGRGRMPCATCIGSCWRYTRCSRIRRSCWANSAAARRSLAMMARPSRRPRPGSS